MFVIDFSVSRIQILNLGNVATNRFNWSAANLHLDCLKTAFFGNFYCPKTGSLRPINVERFLPNPDELESLVSISVSVNANVSLITGVQNRTQHVYI